MKLKREVPRHYQGKNDNACGPVCINMVVDYYRRAKGKKITKQEKENILKLTMGGDPFRSGTSKPTMIKTIREMGLDCEEITGKVEGKIRFNRLEEAIKKQHPVILGCNDYFTYYGRVPHYVVLTGIDDDKYIYINDPYRGKPDKIEREIFKKMRISSKVRERGKTMSWGDSRWGIEIFEEGT